MSKPNSDLLPQTHRQLNPLEFQPDVLPGDEALSVQSVLAELKIVQQRLANLENSYYQLQQTVLGLTTKSSAAKCEQCAELSVLIQEINALKAGRNLLTEENSILNRPLAADQPANDADCTRQLTMELLPVVGESPAHRTDGATLVSELVLDQTDVGLELTKQLSPEEKIALFEELFAWRRDVCAERWESQQTGASGYKPSRHHNYGAHYVSGKKVPCPGPPTCPDNPLTRVVLKHHLQGKVTVGVYPMMEDDNCRFLVIDLDEKHIAKSTKCSKPAEPWLAQAPPPRRELESQPSVETVSVDSCLWHDDARCLITAAKQLGVPTYLERSRSGRGGHLWIFFSESVSASLARRLGEILLTNAQRDTGRLGLRSYDRMFPNQDTLPKKGYGNLIALPLQKEALGNGNSAFIDEDMQPFPDQWAILQSVKKLGPADVRAIVELALQNSESMSVSLPSEHEDDDKVDPWALPPSKQKKEQFGVLPALSEMITLTLCNFVYIPKKDLTQRHLNVLERLAAFQNPEFYRNQRLRLSNYKTPRIISCAEEFPDHLALPRGCFEGLEDLLKKSSASYTIDDKRISGQPLSANFIGTLRDDQQKAVESLLGHDFGVLCAVPGFGKTVVAAYCIAQRKVSTLILVHRQQLLRQWKDRLKSFLDIPATSIGEVGGGKKKATGVVDIATVQSLNKKGDVENLVADYGQVIVDECHGVGSVDFEQVLRQVKAKYVLGLTATPVRYDGHHPIIVMQCGPIRHRVRHTDVETGITEHVVLPRFTKAALPEHAEGYSVQEIIGELTADELRNKLIVADVLNAVSEKRSPIVLTKRKEHLQILLEMLKGKVKNIIVFQGGLGLKKLAKLTEQLSSVPRDEERVVLAIGQCIGEGFDDPRLDTLFLAMPISFRGRLEQYVGRLHRAHEGKSIVKIYDYVDVKIEAMYRMYKKRRTGYKQIGYEIDMPG